MFQYTWRVGDEGLYRGYPALAERLWDRLPSDFSSIDAVYERADKKIVFFIGNILENYYVFSYTVQSRQLSTYETRWVSDY